MLGDGRSLDGSVDYVRTPPSFPYIPGHDICGVVVEMPPGDETFVVGDVVVTTSKEVLLMGGLAEYSLASIRSSALKPDGLSVESAAASGTSAQRALFVCKNHVRQGDRVLVLGGSGGFGTYVVQMLKSVSKASFVVATSTQTDLLKHLGVDEVVNYTTTNWWEMKRDIPFDVIIDCCPATGAHSFRRASKVLKSGWQGGRFIAVTAENPDMQIHSAWDMMGMMGSLFKYPFITFFRRGIPRYKAFLAGFKKGHLEETLELLNTGSVKTVFGPPSPLQFTVEDAKKGFEMVASKHAHGKIVIRISES